MRRLRSLFCICLALSLITFAGLNNDLIDVRAEEVRELSGNEAKSTQESNTDTEKSDHAVSGDDIEAAVSENTGESSDEETETLNDEEPVENSETIDENTISGNETPDDETDEAETEADEENGEEESEESSEEVSENEIKTGEVEIPRPDVVSIELPVVDEKSGLFDFILDPYKLITATGAVRYGGKKFQDDATVFFRNTKGDVDYSDTSDYLEIINRSTVSANITVSVNLLNIEDVSIAQDPDTVNSGGASVYFELIDDEGNAIPLDDEGKAMITKQIDAAPSEAYMFIFNEEKAGYEVKSETEGIEFPKYRFAVKALCGGDGWSKVFKMPRLEIKWAAVPVQKNDDDAKSEDEDIQEVDTEPENENIEIEDSDPETENNEETDISETGEETEE